MEGWEELTKSEWYRRMAPGSESDWIELATLNIHAGKLAISDPECIGDYEFMCRVFDVEPASYVVSVKVIHLANGEQRNSRMRASSIVNPVFGGGIDAVGVDSWHLTIYDPTAWEQSGCTDSSAVERFVREFWNVERFAVLRSPGQNSVLFPCVFSGMGDGHYPVHELIHDGKRVGMEVVFIGLEALRLHPDQVIIQRTE